MNTKTTQQLDAWDKQPIKPEYTQSDVDEAVQAEKQRVYNLAKPLIDAVNSSQKPEEAFIKVMTLLKGEDD